MNALQEKIKFLFEKFLDTPALHNFAIFLGAAVVIHLIFLVIFISGGQASAPEDETSSVGGNPTKQEELPPEFPEGPAAVLTGALNRTGAHQGDFSGNYESKQVQSGMLFDTASGKVLWEKESAQVIPTGAIARLMTLLLIQEALADGRLTLDQQNMVTPDIDKIGGTSLDLRTGETFSVEELRRGAAILGANDATAMLAAQLFDGDLDKFVRAMNQRAKELGMTQTRFYSVHGLDAGERQSFSTAEDLVRLAAQLIQYPDLLAETGTVKAWFRPEGAANRKMMTNFNNLVVKNYPGIDGLATGRSGLAGYGVVFSWKHNGKYRIGVVLGVPAVVDRDNFVKKLQSWAD